MMNDSVKKDNVIKRKSFEFAVRIIPVCQKLQNEKKEYILSKQLLRSATSVGANVREADNAESKADFIHKMGIAQKEADETIYWIELLHASALLSKEDFEILKPLADELLKIIRSIIITSKKNR
jgi:four helix bundle protein